MAYFIDRRLGGNIPRAKFILDFIRVSTLPITGFTKKGGKRLISLFTDRPTREKALEALRTYILSTRPFTELELLKLWKGLFFCTQTSPLLTPSTLLPNIPSHHRPRAISTSADTPEPT
jgi:hypothetical protein